MDPSPREGRDEATGSPPDTAVRSAAGRTAATALNPGGATVRLPPQVRPSVHVSRVPEADAQVPGSPYKHKIPSSGIGCRSHPLSWPWRGRSIATGKIPVDVGFWPVEMRYNKRVQQWQQA